MFQEFRGNLLSLVERSICNEYGHSGIPLITHHSDIKVCPHRSNEIGTKFVENEKVSISLRLFTVEGRCPN
jgi:hypothetical protein